MNTVTDPLPEVFTVAAFFSALEADRVQAGIAEELERAVQFVAAVPVPAPLTAGINLVPARNSGPVSGGGHSDAWWQGVAMCEQGGRNDPYYGYLSFMDGSQGGKPWAEQVAAANDLISRYPGAWAQACVDAGYRASPNG